MTDAIAWAFVHFLWQGTALALVAALLMRLASAASARYMIGVATLAAMVVVVVLTAARMSTVAPEPHSVQGPTESTVQSSSGVTALRLDMPLVQESRGPEVQRLPTAWIVAAWIIGVVVLSVRALGGWWLARRVAREAITPLSDELQAVATALAERLGVHRVVGVYESTRVSVPVMIGWLRPVVLMPPAALSGLSVAQVEAIFAHEFAHIRRHDYLVNLLQTAVETMLFFHPAVWWVSREIRRERELCCDDLAVSVSDRLTYATALSALAHLHSPSLALAATDGSLRDRVRRIVTGCPTSDSSKGGWMAVLPLLLVVSLASPSAFTDTVDRPSTLVMEAVQQLTPSQPVEPPAMATPQNDVVPLASDEFGLGAPQTESPRDQTAAVAPPALPVVSNYFIVPTHAMALQPPPPPQVVQSRRIAADDIVRLTWTGIAGADADLNGRYVVAADGTITVKYIGFVPVAGKTVAEIETSLVAGMTGKQIYPAGVISVTAETAPDDRRNITIQGQVARPGEKRLFPEEMTVSRAIDVSGGLLPSAGDIQIRRRGVDQPINITLTQRQAGADLALLDGDTVIVRQGHVFFVNGEVISPGQKVWAEGMTVLKAVALAGGMTPGGKLSHISRPVKDATGKILKYEKIKLLKLETEILPDDQVVIARKWFGE